MTKNKEPVSVFELFLQDMEQPAIQMAIYSSYRRYAVLRDKLISEYVAATGIPADEFHSAMSRKLVTEMYG